MKSLKTVLCLAIPLGCILTAGCGIFGGEPEKPADISLNVLEKRMHKAMDPTGAYRNAQSYVQKQMLEIKRDWSGKKSFIVEVKFKRPDLFKTTTIEDNRKKDAVIFNGKKAWLVDYRNKQVIPIKGTKFEKLKVLFSIGRPDSTYEDVFKKVVVTETTIDNKPYYKLLCISKIKEQDPISIYVGKNNFLTKRLETIERINGRPEKYISTIDKYTMHDGVMIPAETTVQLDNVKQKSIVILYKLNAKIKDSEFKPPTFINAN
ncbi:hypothetical protein P0136_07930 [Lentisphaerota bacterium ZTH]|nr:hypothetical protein JYG24_00960 [Lentisphaerota bacterium]WET05294.1 hypothetical protein P0136_07930 [Lentisphaerota bacterium ZTH]